MASPAPRWRSVCRCETGTSPTVTTTGASTAAATAKPGQQRRAQWTMRVQMSRATDLCSGHGGHVHRLSMTRATLLKAADPPTYRPVSVLLA